MTSARKIEVNRKNARASTGAKTMRGRARAARNALRHGLSLSVCSDPVLSEEVETLAREIAGPNANPEIQGAARRVAEAHIDAQRVRCARHQLLSDALGNEHYDSFANVQMKLKVAARILRGKEHMSPEEFAKFVDSPKGPEKFASILAGEANQLLAMDRYERRALIAAQFRDPRLRCGTRSSRNHGQLTPEN
jgi:hypothetical protein